MVWRTRVIRQGPSTLYHYISHATHDHNNREWWIALARISPQLRCDRHFRANSPVVFVFLILSQMLDENDRLNSGYGIFTTVIDMHIQNNSNDMRQTGIRNTKKKKNQFTAAGAVRRTFRHRESQIRGLTITTFSDICACTVIVCIYSLRLNDFFFKVSFWCGHRLKIRRFLSVCACEVWFLMAIAILHAIRILKCTANCRHRVRLPTRATIGYSGNNGIIRIYRLFRVTFYRFHNRFVYCPLTMSLRRSRRCHCRIITIKPLLGVI